MNTTLCPLLTLYPLLQTHVPYVRLADLPTPISRASHLEHALNIDHVYIKHDEVSGALDRDIRLFGGNKIRKLEFLLADAMRKGVKTVITCGGVGSNHALATTVYAKKLGLKVVIMLEEQSTSAIVQRNLLLDYYYGAQMYHYATRVEREADLPQRIAECTQRDGVAPYVIPSGGSMPVGVMGMINAAFELREQIQQGVMPEPDVLYVAFGSMGTVAGLLIGLRAAGLKTKVIAVRVTSDQYYNDVTLQKLILDTLQFVYAQDASFPAVQITHDDYELRHEFFGAGYAQETQQAAAAVALFNKTEQSVLDGTYTGKAAAALVHDAQHGRLSNKVTLFWHTFCSDSFVSLTQQVNYLYLAQPFHKYFV